MLAKSTSYKNKKKISFISSSSQEHRTNAAEDDEHRTMLN
jgi:hypothetical protein